MRNQWILIIILIILISSGVLIAARGDGNGGSTINPTPTSDLRPTLDPTSTPRVPDNWQAYTSQTHDFSIQHPPDVEVQQRPVEAVRFIKPGPTQEEGTEVYDALSLTFNSGTYNDQPLEEFVEIRQNELDNDPIVEFVGSVEPVTINGISGYQFDVRSLGERTYIYLPKNDNQYLEIINGTVDPTNQGFLQTVDLMLSTLETN